MAWFKRKLLKWLFTADELGILRELVKARKDMAFLDAIKKVVGR